jgi:myo-inositol-1(or 4)-monophosphatase
VTQFDNLLRIGEAVRDIINERYPKGGGERIIKPGADGDWTKEIDQVAETAAFDMIKEMELDWNIISEESGAIEGQGDTTLLFDPIDGSYNATNGIPFYSTSLALMEPDGEITAGVVMDIPMNRCFHAVKGKGAFVDRKRIHTRSYKETEAVFSSFLGPDAMEENRTILSWPKRGRYFGSISLELCFVAKGALDLFALFSRIPRIMDIAAGHLILKEAGGEHIKLLDDGSWSRYSPGDVDDRIKGIIAIGDKHAVGRIMEISERTIRSKEERLQ